MELPPGVLVVTDSSSATPELLEAVRDRARRGPARFFVLVPNPSAAEWHPLHPRRHQQLEEAERTLLQSLPAIQDAVDDAVRGRVSLRHDLMAAVDELLHEEPFDEILVVIHPHPLERRLHVDLPHRLAHLGLPVTTVIHEHPGRR
jgi:hypothetical protein